MKKFIIIGCITFVLISPLKVGSLQSPPENRPPETPKKAPKFDFLRPPPEIPSHEKKETPKPPEQRPPEPRPPPIPKETLP